MTDWTAGYVADIGYTFGYYQELNPQRVRLAFINQGLAYPEMGAACELGFGQGVSANIHAAASVTQWHGTDFNPSQAGFAQSLAGATGSNAKFYDQAFDEFAKRDDLPEFDYIGLHGIWSWISDENRQVIVDFVRSRLKVGGVLYISYNTLPGWSTFAPMRHLMTEHAQVLGAEGRGIVSRIDGALEFTDKLLATNPLFSRANPAVVERLQKVKEHNRHYLAHEYFNRDWHPMHFATMAQWLQSAKVQYACSANYLDHLDSVNLSPDQQAFLKDIPDPMFRETTRDFMVNQQFRRDYWVRGARKLTPLERTEALRALRVVLTSYRPEISLKVTGAQSEVTMNENVYGSILDILGDYRITSLAKLEQDVTSKGVSFAQLVEAVVLLTGAGHLAIVQEDAHISKSRKHAEQLNAQLMHKARGNNDVSYLASPVTGGGVLVGRFAQLFLLSMSQGKKKPEEWAQFVWQVLSSQGQKLIKDSKVIDADADNLAEITEQAIVFAQKQLPIIKALGIA